jgi:predicted MFS family arabinose efflux permease
VASIRALWLRIDDGAPALDLTIPLGVGAAGGAAFGLVLGIWSLDPRASQAQSATRVFAYTMFGCGIGAAAGAQVTADVGWTPVVLVPILVIGGAALVASHRRRQQRRTSLARAVVGPPEPLAAPRNFELPPSDQSLVADEPR